MVSSLKAALMAACLLTPMAARAASSVTITAQQQGATQFIELLAARFDSDSTLASVQFTVAPKSGSVTRPISATYSAAYMIAQGYWNGTGTRFHVPVFGLYAGATNSVALTFTFTDGSVVQQTDTITTAAYTDSCGALNNGQVIVNRRQRTDELSFDYMLLKKNCDTASPTILDTDGEVRWIGDGSAEALSVIFYQNQLYITGGKTDVLVMSLDGSKKRLADYRSIGVTSTNHHNYDPGRDGIIMDVNTTTETEAVDMEIDAMGNVLHTWDFGQIISQAMVAGGDDPATFVYPVGNDWFHNNASTYNPADNTLVASSRENFVIAVDYDTQQIKWILGDKTKHWYQFKSLRKFALALGPRTLAPIGQHAVSFDHNGDLLLYDDGFQSLFQVPPGKNRSFSSPRAYHIDTTAMTATETYQYPQHKSIYTQICGSVYEDAPNTFLIDYATEDARTMTELVGLTSSSKKIFDYLYPDVAVCGTTWNTDVIHLEYLQF